MLEVMKVSIKFESFFLLLSIFVHFCCVLCRLRVRTLLHKALARKRTISFPYLFHYVRVMADKILRGRRWKYIIETYVTRCYASLSRWFSWSLDRGVGGISKLQNPYGPSVECAPFWTYLKRRQNHPSVSEYHNDVALRTIADHTGPGIHILLSFG